jgi:hypothetical protein
MEIELDEEIVDGDMATTQLARRAGSTKKGGQQVDQPHAGARRHPRNIWFAACLALLHLFSTIT